MISIISELQFPGPTGNVTRRISGPGGNVVRPKPNPYPVGTLRRQQIAANFRNPTGAFADRLKKKFDPNKWKKRMQRRNPNTFPPKSATPATSNNMI